MTKWTGCWCYWCQLRPADGWDHLIPRSRGGSSRPDNMVPACGDCNSQKGNKTPAEYGQWLLRRALLYSTVCPACGAGPGERCTNRARREPAVVRDVHAARKAVV